MAVCVACYRPLSFSDLCLVPDKWHLTLWGQKPKDGCLGLWGPTWEWEDVGRCWWPEAAAAQSVWGRQWALCAGHGWGARGGQSDTLAGMCQACLGMSAHDSPLLAPLWQAPSSGSPGTQNTVGQRSEPETGEEKLRLGRAWQAFKVSHSQPQNLSLLFGSGRNNGKGR